MDGRATHWLVRPPGDGDLDRWRQLYREYADFYGVAQTDHDATRVWSWICDPQHEMRCLLVSDLAGHVAGLAHYRPFVRPLSASTGCFLDDLFVDPAQRGAGAVDALLVELRRIAAKNGWNVVRWITAEDNYRGRGKYDKYATRTMWVTYDMGPT